MQEQDAVNRLREAILALDAKPSDENVLMYEQARATCDAIRPGLAAETMAAVLEELGAWGTPA